MAKARDILGRSGAGGFVPPPQTKKLDLTVPDETEEKKQDTKHHLDKAATPKGQTKGGGGGTPTSVRPKV